MFLVDNALSGVHAKQGCYLCGSPNQLVDTEISIDYEGVLAICRACVRAAALAAGFQVDVEASELEAVKRERDDLERTVMSAEQALAEISETAIAAKKRYKNREEARRKWWEKNREKG